MACFILDLFRPTYFFGVGPVFQSLDSGHVMQAPVSGAWTHDAGEPASDYDIDSSLNVGTTVSYTGSTWGTLTKHSIAVTPAASGTAMTFIVKALCSATPPGSNKSSLGVGLLSTNDQTTGEGVVVKFGWNVSTQLYVQLIARRSGETLTGTEYTTGLAAATKIEARVEVSADRKSYTLFVNDIEHETLTLGAAPADADTVSYWDTPYSDNKWKLDEVYGFDGLWDQTAIMYDDFATPAGSDALEGRTPPFGSQWSGDGYNDPLEPDWTIDGSGLLTGPSSSSWYAISPVSGTYTAPKDMVCEVTARYHTTAPTTSSGTYSYVGCILQGKGSGAFYGGEFSMVAADFGSGLVFSVNGGSSHGSGGLGSDDSGNDSTPSLGLSLGTDITLRLELKNDGKTYVFFVNGTEVLSATTTGSVPYGGDINRLANPGFYYDAGSGGRLPAINSIASWFGLTAESPAFDSGPTTVEVTESRFLTLNYDYGAQGASYRQLSLSFDWAGPAMEWEAPNPGHVAMEWVAPIVYTAPIAAEHVFSLPMRGQVAMEWTASQPITAPVSMEYVGMSGLATTVAKDWVALYGSAINCSVEYVARDSIRSAVAAEWIARGDLEGVGKATLEYKATYSIQNTTSVIISQPLVLLRS